MRTKLALVLVLVACLASSAVVPSKAGATSQVKQGPTGGCGGEWQIVPSPSPGTADVLYGIDGVASDDIWAVGTSAGEHTLIEHWDGTSWEIVPSPDAGTEQNILYGVSAASSSDAWAVGFYADVGLPLRNLILHWDGSVWSVAPSANKGADNNQLRGVSATSAVDAWAVGSYISRQGKTQALIEHWDGQSWAIVESGGIAAFSALVGVSADSSSDVWAVGQVGPFEVVNWDGLEWTRSDLPAVPRMAAVWAGSPSDVWVAGRTPNRSAPLAFHWDGSSWEIWEFSRPNKARQFAAVSGSSSSDVWFVGYRTQPSEVNSIAWHWNGAAFTQLDPPTPGRNALYGVVDLAPDDVWAVGWISMQPMTEIQRTFIVHFC